MSGKLSEALRAMIEAGESPSWETLIKDIELLEHYAESMEEFLNDNDLYDAFTTGAF